MRLTIPEPKFSLYKDGFEQHDMLSRKRTGEKLSKLIEDIEDPLVVALDGAWGSGKSHFLKCWIGEHLGRQENSTQVVYFDAFRHDYLSDPLIALTGVIVERFNSSDELEEDDNSKRGEKLKTAAWVVGRALLRAGASYATLGATEAFGNLGDKLAEAAGEEANALIDNIGVKGEANKFWSEHYIRVASNKAFRSALIELTEPQKSDEERPIPTRKLVIVIDELDRCRPDFALSLLEVIKHYFNVDGVHFVLGVNLKELQNSVRARYGSEIDANNYLQKFVDLTFNLNSKRRVRADRTDSVLYFKKICEVLDLEYHFLNEPVTDIISAMPSANQPSLRELERLATEMVVTPVPDKSGHIARVCLAMLLVAKSANNELYQGLINRTVKPESVHDYFGVTDRHRDSWGDLNFMGYLYWIPILTHMPETKLPDEVKGVFSSYGLDDVNITVRKRYLKEINEDSILAFEFMR